MPTPAIAVESLSKCYRLGQTASPRRMAARIRASILGRASANDDEQTLWALRDVSFEVPQGEVLGIIGRNGAGKSTLLKILSRITAPSSGRATLRGRVSSLLEVGTGFHPELTGRENVYMNGSILGLARQDIDRRFDEIVEFSGVERFLDTPLKRYSSGMQVRLAFAVAAHLEPDVLIIDEVLAVGDARFQRQCLGRMRDASESGRTVLLVSHNMQAISTLAHRCIVLEQGSLLHDGTPDEAISTYLQRQESRAGLHTREPSGEEPCITRIEVHTSEAGSIQHNGREMTLEFEVATAEPISGASLSFQICDELGRPVIHLWTFDSERQWCRSPGRHRARCVIPKLRLYMGKYSITAHFTEAAGGRRFETLEGVCPFEVVMLGQHRDFSWRPHSCTYLEDCQWSVQAMSDDA